MYRRVTTKKFFNGPGGASYNEPGWERIKDMETCHLCGDYRLTRSAHWFPISGWICNNCWSDMTRNHRSVYNKLYSEEVAQLAARK